MLLRTKLHHYSFPSSDHPGYKAMVAEIEANNVGRGHCMSAFETPSKSFDGTLWQKQKELAVEEVVLDTEYFFENQWNEAKGSGNRRLFDWREFYYGNGRPDKTGHWLEITPEMAQLRTETFKCGYCGELYGPQHITPIPESGFCTACIGGLHLKQDELYLLRLRRVVGGRSRGFPKLTAEESELLTPLYIEEQTISLRRAEERARQKDKEDIDGLVAKATRKAEALIRDAKEERDGKIWLWERGFQMDNVIYYSHSRQFGFGWRQPVSNDVRDKLLEVISEFPAAYTIKCEDGKTLERIHRTRIMDEW